jgi:hypothetical protein
MTAVINEDIIKVFIAPNISNMKQFFCVKVMGIVNPLITCREV